mmetsp:Transcript_129047/g.373397  ORF Transcript_129047/g.373397 Transcript_129047/m.373397 type:complete len:316 (+) Transcript_129047:1654-2601(+)
MRVVVHILEGVLQVRHLRQDVPGVSQALGLEVKQDFLARLLRVLDDLVDEHRLDLKILERADVGVREHRLLGLQASNNVHACLLHDREEVRIVTRPLHVPDILALEVQLLSGGGFRGSLAVRVLTYHGPAAHRLHLDVVERQHAIDVNDRHPGAVAIRSNNLRTTSYGEAGFQAQVRQGIPLHHAALARDEEALLRGRDASDGVLRRRRWRNEAILVVEATAGRERLVDVKHHLRAPLAAHAQHGGGCGQVVGLLGDAVAVHPDVHHILRGNDDMGIGHGHMRGLNVQVLRVHRAANVVADYDDVLAARVVRPGH